MTNLRMSHVGICVSDWKRSMRFYRELLGFEYVRELETEGAPTDTLLRLEGVRLRAVYLARDGLTIELLHYESPGHAGPAAPRPMNQLGVTHLSLRVDDLDAFVATLREAGANVLDDTRIDIPAARTKAIFLTDPDGTLIELVQQPGA